MEAGKNKFERFEQIREEESKIWKFSQFKFNYFFEITAPIA
jgi:hypothetical protein